jgi:4,5-dihydroxyphthalate decarboxylase
MKLLALLGDYPLTRALKQGEVFSPSAEFDFAVVKTPNQAFKRVVRDLEFDVAELAIVTFLMAKAYAKPLVLLPAVVLSRDQHPYLVYNAERGHLAPADLAGKRVGIRSYSVTTATWIRGILADDYRLDPDRVRWLAFEEPHVAEYRDPQNVERAAQGSDMLDMLIKGEIDAAVVAAIPDDPRLKTVIPDPEAAASGWRERNRALQINHMVVVKESLSRTNPQAVQEFYRMLAQSKARAGLPAAQALDLNPFGVEANRRNLEVAIDYVYRQKLIPRRFGVDELFDDVTRKL